MSEIVLPEEMCCGCRACESVCKKEAISFVWNRGFLYAQIDSEKCVQCGACTRVCPILEKVSYTATEIKEVYAAYCTDAVIRQRSSSGGINRALIDSFMSDNNSVVYGSALKNNEVKHVRCNSNELDSLYGSKYVVSDMNGIIPTLISDLENGMKVLFTGTPCQVAGVVNSCPRQYKDKLYTIDLVCHGPGSKKVWTHYINFLKEKYTPKLEFLSFRDKSGGWKNYSMKIKAGDRFYHDTTAIRTWQYMFFAGLLQNKSCFNCKFATRKRYSDITLSDFWGIEKVDMNMANETKGLSMVMINTQKGKELFESVKNIQRKLEPLNTSIAQQANLNGGHNKPDNYEEFWNDYVEKGFGYIAKKYGHYSIIGKIRNKLVLILRERHVK